MSAFDPQATSFRAICYFERYRNLFAAGSSNISTLRIPPMPLTQARQVHAEALSDEDLVQLARRRDEAAVRAITVRYNRRLFRIARSILRNDSEAEDVVQETYVRAFTGLDMFRGDAAFGTWITRIAMNEALGRLRRRRPTVDWDTYGANRHQAEIINFPASAASSDPEQEMAQGEIRAVLEHAIDQLPAAFRVVFVARIVEGISIEETADLFGLQPARDREDTIASRATAVTERIGQTARPCAHKQLSVRWAALRMLDRGCGSALRPRLICGNLLRPAASNPH
jgi:RNA polymerase sigma-70 factor, ECF subfamily